MRYLLTGATGFVGGAIVRRLVEDGHSVRAIVRTPARATTLAALGVELHEGDVTDKASMRTPMVGIDGVFHVAGWYKLTDREPEVARAVNVDGTRNVLELMHEVGVPRGVYTSTLAVNSDTHGELVDESYRFRGRHLSVYDQTKAEAHDIAEAFIERGLPLTIVQPGLIYGPGDTSSVRKTLINLLRGRLPMVPAKTTFCWSHVDDIAAGHTQALERGAPGRAYFLAGPVHTLLEAIELAARTAGVAPPRLHVSPAVMRMMAAMASVVGRVVPLPADYSADSLRELAGTTYIGSNRRAREELGWQVRPLHEGWVETVRKESGSVLRKT
jgi:nucleoside-diphosphate-sugar epimerase